MIDTAILILQYCPKIRSQSVQLRNTGVCLCVSYISETKVFNYATWLRATKSCTRRSWRDRTDPARRRTMWNSMQMVCVSIWYTARFSYLTITIQSKIAFEKYCNSARLRCWQMRRRSRVGDVTFLQTIYIAIHAYLFRVWIVFCVF